MRTRPRPRSVSGFDTVYGSGGTRRTATTDRSVGSAGLRTANQKKRRVRGSAATERAAHSTAASLPTQEALHSDPHRLSTVRNAARILAMDDGRVVEDGAREALLRAGGLYANLWRVQVGDVTSLPREFLEPDPLRRTARRACRDAPSARRRATAQRDGDAAGPPSLEADQRYILPNIRIQIHNKI